eukprot:3239065-Amphidinium_carterae.1
MGTRVDAPYVPYACVWCLLADPRWAAHSHKGAVNTQDPLQGYEVLSRRVKPSACELPPPPPARVFSVKYSQHALYSLLNEYRHVKPIRNNADVAARNVAVSLVGARLRSEEVQAEASKMLDRQRTPGVGKMSCFCFRHVQHL